MTQILFFDPEFEAQDGDDGNQFLGGPTDAVERTHADRFHDDIE